MKGSGAPKSTLGDRLHTIVGSELPCVRNEFSLAAGSPILGATSRTIALPVYAPWPPRWHDCGPGRGAHSDVLTACQTAPPFGPPAQEPTQLCWRARRCSWSSRSLCVALCAICSVPIGLARALVLYCWGGHGHRQRRPPTGQGLARFVPAIMASYMDAELLDRTPTGQPRGCTNVGGNGCRTVADDEHSK